jgi:transposase
MDAVIVGVICGVAAGVIVLIIAMFLPRKKCPGCGMVLPRFRKPANTRQALWGGWTCPTCHLEMDRKGNRVESKKSS